MKSNRLPHVALLIETSRSYGRALLRGVRQYMTERGPWSAFVELRALESKPPPWLKSWQGDGILTRTSSQAMADAVAAAGVPAVELRATRIKHQLPFVGIDNFALGRLVAQHFLERGFQHFGVYAFDAEEYFQQRCESFQTAISEAGFACSVHEQRGRQEKPAQWELQQEELVRWLARLPKPVGILACTDQLGYWLLDACKRGGLAVPEQVAVVGVENDESLCTMASPPLSSVPLGGQRAGYEAAAMLDCLMQGREPPTRCLMLAPPDMVVRQSSDMVAIADPDLAQAVQYIRLHACHGVSVDDVLRAVPLSRSSLERKMRSLLGRSPNAEINRVRLLAVKQLLADTDLSLDLIARKAGFQHPQYMSELFKRTFGQTPGAYRAQCRS